MAVLRRGNPNEEYDTLKRKAVEARRNQDREVYLNIAFYLGDQYSEWVTLKDGSGLLRAIPTPNVSAEESLPRPTINKIMHFVNSQLAYAMKTKPVADVLPADLDPLSIGDARVATAYIRYLEEPNVANFANTMWDANLWALVANEAYLKWCYNPQEKRPDVIFCPSTDIASDPYATDFYRARWLVHTQFLDPEAVYDAYDKDPDKLKDARMTKTDLEKSKLLQDLGQAPVLDGIEVNEYWARPSRRFPKGRFHVWAGKEVLLHMDELPYDHGELPFTQLGVIPRPRSKHYASPVTFLRAPQIELNKYHSQRLLTRETWALLKLWLPDDIQLEKKWNNSPFQVLRGSSSTGQPPQIIGPPGAMPDNGDGDWLKEEMGNVVGIHEVSEGQVPGRVEAAKAIELLREADTSRLAVLLASQATSISKGWWQVLSLARQYIPDEVVVAAYGPDGVPEVHRFMTDTFKPGQRIRVTLGSGLALSSAARLDQLTTLWQQGVIVDREVFAQLADIPVPQIISAKAFDVLEARNENLILAEGTPMTANSWDDHTVHLREHNNYRKTAEFAAKSPEVKQMFEHHTEEHRTMELTKLKEDAQKALLMQQAMGPPPQGAGDPGANAGGAQPPPAGTADEAVVS